MVDRRDVMRCNLLKVVVDGKTLAMWALMGERGSGKSTLVLPHPAWAAKVAGRRCSGGRRRWGDGVVASREADADVQPTGGHGGCVHGAAVHRGDR